MITILKISFDSIIDEEFEVRNPPILPDEGETLDFKWSDFITDDAELEKLEASNDSNIWIANILCKTYSKTEVTVHIVLFEEQNYISFRRNSKLYGMDYDKNIIT